MKKVFIKPGCITCGLCEFLAPQVFEVTDVSRVRSDAVIQGNEIQIQESALECPVQVIVYEPEK
ncbi:ferredoxin [bacterium]|jgi:ferredoxin|nr:ferredoxin [bacterium]NBX78640.1 ferredoxin [bacterium]